MFKGITENAAVIPIRGCWPWAASAIQALPETLCFPHIPAWLSQLVPPTRLSHPRCSVALPAKYLENQSSSEEVGRFSWQGRMWEKDVGLRGVCTVRMIEDWDWGLGEGDAGGDKNGNLGLYWFRLLRILVLFQKVYFASFLNMQEM